MTKQILDNKICFNDMCMGSKKINSRKSHQSPLPDLPELGMGSSEGLSTGLPHFPQPGNLLLYG